MALQNTMFFSDSAQKASDLLNTCKKYYFSRKLGLALFMVVVGCCATSVHARAPQFGDKTMSSAMFVTILASPTIAVVHVSQTSSELLSGSDKKIIMHAKEDAASFVASDGQHRGVFLESALKVLAAHGVNHSDMELAMWIMSAN